MPLTDSDVGTLVDSLDDFLDAVHAHVETHVKNSTEAMKPNEEIKKAISKVREAINELENVLDNLSPTYSLETVNYKSEQLFIAVLQLSAHSSTLSYDEVNNEYTKLQSTIKKLKQAEPGEKTNNESVELTDNPMFKKPSVSNNQLSGITSNKKGASEDVSENPVFMAFNKPNKQTGLVNEQAESVKPLNQNSRLFETKSEVISEIETLAGVFEPPLPCPVTAHSSPQDISKVCDALIQIVTEHALSEKALHAVQEASHVPNEMKADFERDVKTSIKDLKEAQAKMNSQAARVEAAQGQKANNGSSKVVQLENQLKQHAKDITHGTPGQANKNGPSTPT